MDANVSQQWPADRVERRPIASLIPSARNARTHSPEQIAAIAASMREWGWTNPVLLDETGGIIAGHGRILAAQALGWPEAPVMIAIGWTDAQKRAYALADNKLALNSGWDAGLLAVELADLKEMKFDDALLGFSKLERDLLTVPANVQFDAPPEEVRKNAESLRELRNRQNASVASKNDTEKYLVIVFANRAERERAAQLLGLSADERYVDSRLIRLSAAATDVVQAAPKAASTKNAGAGG